MAQRDNTGNSYKPKVFGHFYVVLEVQNYTCSTSQFTQFPDFFYEN